MKYYPRSSLIGRWALALVLTMALGLVSWRHLKIEQDVVASIEKSRPEETAIFHKLQGSGFFQNQVFIHMISEDPALHDQVMQKLRATGYDLSAPFEAHMSSPRDLYKLLPFLPEAVRNELLSQTHQDQTLTLLKSWMNAPGGLGLAKLLAEDPLLLSMALPKLIQGDPAIRDHPPLVAKRSGDINWEKTRELYNFVKAHDHELSFISGDFFALENYDAVRHDIMVCSLLSIVLSLIVFRYFCPQWSLLGFLLAGTAMSSVVGLLLAEVVDGAIYGLVLAFTSTFVSFNNETLVHLSGIDLKDKDKRSIIGVFSALGTTVIGFLVLLFSSSHMTRQIALLSLGSLIGFILFLLLFLDRIKEIRFRPLVLRHWMWSKPVLASTFALVLTLILWLPKPSYRTNLEEFRYATAYLEEQTSLFTKNFSALSFERMQALPLSPAADPAVVFQRLASEHRLESKSFHPLTWFVNEEEQRLRIERLQSELSGRLAAMQVAFQNEGLNLTIVSDPGRLMGIMGSVAFLRLWEKVWPLPWYSEGAKGPYLLAFINPEARIEGAIPLHPKAFYEFILSDLTRNLGTLFLIGLFIMLLYLVPWQRDWAKVTMIFLPLLIATLGLQIFFYGTGRDLTIVHVMGLALVIAVSLDYAAILVSTEHDPRDQGKVVLTGGLTLSSFGSLLFAQHPVLKELAIVVVIGTLVAFIMALFTRLPASEDTV